MKYPVSNINICFYTLPYKNKQINKKPEIALWLKQFVYIFYKKPGENKEVMTEATAPTIRFGTVNSKVNINQKIIDNIKTVTYLILLIQLLMLNILQDLSEYQLQESE